MVLNRILVGSSAADRALGAYALAVVVGLVTVRVLAYLCTYNHMPGVVALTLLALCAAMFTWVGAEMRSVGVTGGPLLGLLRSLDLRRPRASWMVLLGAVSVASLINYAITGAMQEYALIAGW